MRTPATSTFAASRDKKWFSCHERPLMGRDLRPEAARYVTEMARRIATLLLEPALDANYERVKADTYAWPEAVMTRKQLLGSLPTYRHTPASSTILR